MIKVGDRVYDFPSGKRGVVNAINGLYATVSFDGEEANWPYTPLADLRRMAPELDAAFPAAPDESLRQSGDPTLSQDVAYGYAYDAGLFGSTLRHTLKRVMRLEQIAHDLEDDETIFELRWIRETINDAFNSAKMIDGSDV